ncbi:MAG: MFS transporter [Actinomycetales bacterium]|nr:MFS transporter [Actinomycetales bacterium]
MKSGFRGVWQTPTLRKLVAARFISNLGNGLGPIAIPFGVLALPNTNGTSLSMVWFANMLPLVAFTLIGGVIGDKFPRAQLVGGADILLGLLVLANGISLITGHGALWIFILVGFIGGFLNAIWYPSMGALTSDLADEKILQESNSSIMLSGNIAMIIGTSIGGGLVALYGAGWAIAIDGVSFIVAGLVVYSLRKHTPVAKPTSESTFRELKSGWKEFTSHKWIVAIVAASTILFACERSIYSIIGPLVAKENLGGPKPWALILAIWSIGSVLGVLVAGKAKPKYPIRFALLMQFPSILWALALGNTTSIILIALSSFALGIAMDLFYVFWVTTIQQHVAKDSLSKVLAYDAWGSMAMAPLIMGIAGPITEYFGTKATLNAISIICFITLLLPFLVKEVREIQASS